MKEICITENKQIKVCEKIKREFGFIKGKKQYTDYRLNDFGNSPDFGGLREYTKIDYFFESLTKENITQISKLIKKYNGITKGGTDEDEEFIICVTIHLTDKQIINLLTK